MSKHTPGPWRICIKPKSNHWHAGLTVGTDERTQLRICDPCVLNPNSRANARLIAAAPELLEALIDIERTAGIAASESDPVRVRARAAIAKATRDTA